MQTLNKETTSEGRKKTLLQRSIYYEQVLNIYKNKKLTQGLDSFLSFREKTKQSVSVTAKEETTVFI